MYHLCTCFDRNYLLRGLTLYRSLAATGCDFTLNVLALDKETENTLVRLELPNLRTILLTAPGGMAGPVPALVPRQGRIHALCRPEIPE